jgi:hypothetical protein
MIPEKGTPHCGCPFFVSAEIFCAAGGNSGRMLGLELGRFAEVLFAFGGSAAIFTDKERVFD